MSELIGLKALVRGLDVERAILKLLLTLRRFRPDQPRAPAGTTEGGRWIGGEGGAGSEGGAGIITVADDGRADVDVDLLQDERLGGHTIRDHVGKTDLELQRRINLSRRDAWWISVRLWRAGSFQSLGEANNLVKETLRLNQLKVDEFLASRSNSEFIKHRFGFVTGRETIASAVDGYATPMRKTYGVGVLIIRDRRSKRGYRIHTAYPRNDDQ